RIGHGGGADLNLPLAKLPCNDDSKSYLQLSGGAMSSVLLGRSRQRLERFHIRCCIDGKNHRLREWIAVCRPSRLCLLGGHEPGSAAQRVAVRWTRPRVVAASCSAARLGRG